MSLLSAREIPFEPDGGSAHELIFRHAPDIVLVGTSENPRSVGLALIDAARAAGTMTAAAVDGYANATARFRGESGDARAHAPDLLIVPDPWTQRAYLDLGFERVVDCGHPQYDRVLARRAELDAEGRESVRGRAAPGAGDRPVLVFVAEVSTGLDPEQYVRSERYTLRGRGRSDARTLIVIEEILDALARLELDCHTVLRLHPKNTADELREVSGEFDAISQGGDPLECVFAADVVAGMTSMLLVEAAILGRRTLSVVPREEERDWLFTARVGVTPVAFTPSMLERELEDALGGAPPSACPVQKGSLDRVLGALDNARRA